LRLKIYVPADFFTYSKICGFSASSIETIKNPLLMNEESNAACFNHRLLNSGAVLKLSHYSD
jgi:hypothetical protein